MVDSRVNEDKKSSFYTWMREELDQTASARCKVKPFLNLLKIKMRATCGDLMNARIGPKIRLLLTNTVTTFNSAFPTR